MPDKEKPFKPGVYDFYLVQLVTIDQPTKRCVVAYRGRGKSTGEIPLLYSFPMKVGEVTTMAGIARRECATRELVLDEVRRLTEVWNVPYEWMT